MDEGQRLNDFDRALAHALDVDVSPDFTARVRRRFASEPAPSRGRWGWPLAAAAAATILVAGAALSLLPTRRPVPVPSSAAQSRPLAERRADVQPATARRSDEPPTLVARAVARVPHVVRPEAEAPAGAEVLVPREEIELYRRLIANAQQVPNALVVAAPPDIVAVQSVEIPIDPIRIDLIAPSVDGEGDRQ
jgi:hypothetical protein